MAYVEGLVSPTMLGVPLLTVVAYRIGGCLGSDRLARYVALTLAPLWTPLADMILVSFDLVG